MRFPTPFVSRTLAASCGLFITACDDDAGTDIKPMAPVALKNQSVTPVLAKSLMLSLQPHSWRRWHRGRTGQPDASRRPAEADGD